MKGRIMYQRLHGLVLMLSFIFLSVVYENFAIQEKSTSASQQIDLTTPSQVTGLKPQKTVYISTIMSKSMSVFATDYISISYSSTTSPSLGTMTAPKILKTSTAETAAFTIDILSTSVAIYLPTKKTSISAINNSKKITKSLSSESTVTTRVAGAIVTETFHSTPPTDLLHTSRFTNNSIVSKTSAIGSQLAIMKTTSLYSSIESTSVSATPWYKQKPKGNGTLSVTTASQEFLASAVAGTVPWSIVKQTSTHIWTASAFPPESVLISIAASVDNVFPRNKTASTLAMTDTKIFTVHSTMLPTRPIEMTPELRTPETELTPTNFQDVSSPRVEDKISISISKEASYMSRSFRTSSSFTRAQSTQRVIDAKTTDTVLPPGVTLAPTAVKSMLPPIVTGPVYTQNIPRGDETTFSLISTISASTSKPSESGLTSISGEVAHLFTSDITWTPRPDQTILTSIFHGSASNTEHSLITIDIITLPETSTESEATNIADAIIATDAIIDRSTAVLSNLTSPWLANFSIVPGTTPVAKPPEFNLTTLCIRTTPMFTIARNEFLLTPRKTVVPQVGTISTLVDIESNFSTEEGTSDTTKVETKSTIAFGETIVPIPEPATTQRFSASVTRNETTSHYLKGRLTIAATVVSPVATMREATDESLQMVTASSITVSPLSDLETLTTTMDNKTATTGVKGSWLSPKSVKTTPKTSYNGTTEIFNSTHTYTAHWTSETLLEGNTTPSPTSGSIQTFPGTLVSSTTKILETSFATIPTDRTARSLSTGILPSQPIATHSSSIPVPITHIFSLPVNVFPVTSIVISEETKVTKSESSALIRASSTSVLSGISALSSASVPPWDQTASITSNIMPTQVNPTHTTSETTMISVRMASMAISFLKEAPVSLLRPTTPVVNKVETTLLSPSADTVTSSTPTLACSKSLPDNISVLSSTHMTSTMSTSVATQPISQVEETSTHALSFPYAFSDSENVVSLVTGTTKASVIDETIPSNTSADKLTNSDHHISLFSTCLANTLVSTLSVTDISTFSSDKEQMTTSLRNSSGTMELEGISPSKNDFISESQSTSSLEMTDTGFAETTKVSSHQTRSPSETPLVTPYHGTSTSSPISGSIETILTTWTSSNKDVHISGMSASLGKTALTSQVLTITTFLSPGKEKMGNLSVYTPGTEQMTVTTASVTHQDTLFADNITSKTISISNPVSINTTLSHLFSPRTQPEVTSVASPISENTQTSPESLSSSTAGLSSGSSTVIYTGGIAIPLSAPSVTTAFLGKTSMVTSIPIYRMSLLSVSVTAFTSKRVSDTSTILMTKYSKTKYLDCLKSPSIVTSGPVFEMSSMSVYDSAFLPPVVSSDTSTRVGSFSTSLSSITLRNTKTIHTTTLNATPVIYTGSPSKIPAFSSTFTTSEIKYITSKITPISFPSPTELTYSSMKTIPTTIMAKMVTPFVGSNASFLLSSKNTKTISSIPKTAFSPFLSMTLQSSQGNEATTLDILTGITNSSQSTVSSDSVAVITNTYSRAAAPKGVISPTPSEDLRTSLNIQVSPFLISSKSTPGSTKSIKATSFLPLNTKIVMFLSENTSTAELTKDATSMSTSVSYHARALSSATLPSFISLFFSPHSTKAEFFTTKTCRLPTSHMVEFPVLGTRTPPSNRQSRLMTSWHTLKAEDSQVPIFTTTHVPTPNKMETETTYFVRGSLSTFTASKTNLLSGDVMAISTSGILPTWGIAESLSLSISSRSIPTTLVDIKQTFEKNTTSVTPGTTLPSNSGVASGNIISKTTISPMLIWILSNLPLNPPLEFVSNTPHIIASSTVEVAKSTFLISDMTPTQPITKLTTISFATMSPILTKTTLTTTVGSITTGFPTSLPMLIKITDDIVYISKSPETSRTTVTANSRAVSQISSFSEMSNLSLTTDHTLSIGSIFLPKLTITSTWSRIPAASASPTFVFPKPTLDSFPNITTVTSTATEASFPLISTGVTHPSTAIVSSLLPSSFETTWMDSKPSFLSTETLTSPIAIGSTVSFYNIGMSFSVFDENPVIPISSVLSELAENWLNSIFQNSEFSLVNLAIQIKSRDTSKEEITMERSFIEGQEMATISHILYSCVCQVIIKTNSSQVPSKLISRIKSKIHGNLTHGNFTQNRLTLLVKSKHVAVKKLDPGKCKADQTTSKYKGTYKWLLTNPTETAQTRCIKNEAENATRICSISIYTGKAQWEKPKFKQCKLLQGLPDKIVDLANITISDENADDVAEHILNLINESPSMDEEETKIIVSKLSDISQCDEISMNLTQIILQIINTALRKQNNSLSDLHEVSNEILRIIKRVGHKMEFFGRTANLTVSRLALAVLRVDQTFDGVGFSIRSYEEGTDPEIYLSEVPLGRVLASIYLPKSLRKKIPLNNLQTILFNFFGLTSLFKTKNVAEALTTYVVSASISDTSIQNLADPVVITLQHIEGNQNYDQVHCAFWDFGTNNGQGGWNSSGCKVKETNINYTICHCDHLTHFGVLLDFSRSAVDAVNERILVLITYTGCGISSIFLGVVMVTYIAFHKLRKDYPSKILINLCTALLMLNLVFLVNSWSSSFQTEELCITAAVALHYFLLVSLTWMGLEAVHMYFALVKVFNIYIPNYILKFCVIGWGIPAIMVAIILSVKKDLYGTLSSTSSFCWIKDDSLFYISVVAYFCLIFLMNFSIFHTVLAQLNSIQLQNPKTWQKMILHDLKGTISLTFLLGLTWGFAFFAWGPVRILFLYLFAIFNTLQGFLIFVFHCAMKESVREQWQIHLCCGWPQLENSSDRNSRYELNVGHKQERLKKTFEHKLLTPSLKSTATTSTFNSLGSAQGIPSEISFPNDDFDEDPYCLSHLSCDIVPNCVRRILPAEIKINSIHKKRFLQ